MVISIVVIIGLVVPFIRDGVVVIRGLLNVCLGEVVRFVKGSQDVASQVICTGTVLNINDLTISAVLFGDEGLVQPDIAVFGGALVGAIIAGVGFAIAGIVLILQDYLDRSGGDGDDGDNRRRKKKKKKRSSLTEEEKKELLDYLQARRNSLRESYALCEQQDSRQQDLQQPSYPWDFYLEKPGWESFLRRWKTRSLIIKRNRLFIRDWLRMDQPHPSLFVSDYKGVNKLPEGDKAYPYWTYWSFWEYIGVNPSPAERAQPHSWLKYLFSALGHSRYNTNNYAKVRLWQTFSMFQKDHTFSPIPNFSGLFLVFDRIGRLSAGGPWSVTEICDLVVTMAYHSKRFTNVDQVLNGLKSPLVGIFPVEEDTYTNSPDLKNISFSRLWDTIMIDPMFGVQLTEVTSEIVRDNIEFNKYFLKEISPKLESNNKLWVVKK